MSEEEIATEVVEQIEAYDQVAADDSVNEEVASPEMSDKEINLARLRESKEEFERKYSESSKEVENLRQYTKRLEEMIKSPAAQKQEVVEEEVDEFGDAVDSEYFRKLNARFSAREKEFAKKIAEQEARFEDMRLKELDGNYIDTINKYLPSVVNDDPDIADIIRATPKEKQMRVMLKFAKSNPQYILDKHSSSSDGQSKIEKNLSKTQTLGAIANTSKSAVKENDVWGMSPEQFDAYMAKITQG
jgi:uncharacterized protein YdiU (UPF0061 family)